MGKGAINAEDARFERGRASSDGQEALQASQVGTRGFVEKGAGRCRRCRDPDGVGQSIEAASDASERPADLAERPLLGAHGPEV
jgi:hypothetical protein